MGHSETLVDQPLKKIDNSDGDWLGNAHWSNLTGGLYETTKGEVEPDAVMPNIRATNFKWARWGHDNNYPQRLIDAVKSDPVAALIEKKIFFHWGKGLYFYKKRVEKGKEVIDVVPDEEVPQEIKDFLDENDWPNFMQGIISDYEWWHCFFVQYITSNEGKVLEVRWQRAKNVRPELSDINPGKEMNYYLSGMWPWPRPEQFVAVPAFDKKTKQSGIKRHQFVSIDKDYFPDPAWHSITKWLYISAKIPRWILANIDNSMNIKYHVEIPLKYFLDRHPEDSPKYPTTADRLKAIQDDQADTFKKMDRYLAGEKNVGKAFYSVFATDENGEAKAGWKINILDNKIQDDAWLKAAGTASIYTISGTGLSPSIAGSILPNGLGAGSGSDLREQFNYYIQVNTSIPRQTTLEPWEIIKKLNGWDPTLHLGYKDIVLQSTDQNPKGFAQGDQQNPTGQPPTTN